jgi:hypothetical protein
MLPVVLGAIPPVALAWAVARYGVDVPLRDEWNAVPLLVKASAGTLRLRDLWAQHNEHRVLIPRLVIVGLAQVTGWSIRWELAANVCIALVTLFVYAVLLRRTVATVAPRLAPWLGVAASVQVFSLGQYENWLSGWMVCLYLMMLAVAAGVLALARRGARGVLGMVAAGVAAPLCFGSGLLLLPVLALGTALRRDRRRYAAAGIIAVIGIGVIVVYPVGFEYPTHHPNPLPVLSGAATYARYVLAYLGGAIARDATIAAAFGLVGLVAVAGCGTWLVRRSAAHRAAAVPWATLASFVVLSAVVTASGRAAFGIEQALSSRYVTVSAAFWIAACVLAALVVDAIRRDPAASRGRRTFVTTVPVVFGALAAWSFADASAHDLVTFREWSQALQGAEECLLDHGRAPEGCLAVLLPDENYLRDRIADLERLKLGPFRPGRQPPSLATYTPLAGDTGGWIDSVTVTPHDSSVVVSGWAMDPVRRIPAASVLVVVDGRTIGQAEMGQRRRDVAKRVDPRLRHAGWRFAFRTFRIGPGRHVVDAYALLPERRAVKLAGSRSLDVGS